MDKIAGPSSMTLDSHSFFENSIKHHEESMIENKHDEIIIGSLNKQNSLLHVEKESDIYN